MYDVRGSANDLRPQVGENVMGKIVSAIVAVTLAAGPLLLPAPASAENDDIAAGVFTGVKQIAIALNRDCYRPKGSEENNKHWDSHGGKISTGA